MPLVSFERRERIEEKYHLLVALRAECDACELLKGKKADEEYIYEAYDPDWKPRKIMVAVAQYNDKYCPTYALYAPTDLPENMLSNIFYYFVDEVKKSVEPKDRIIVFSRRDYDAVIKYSPGKTPIDVLLYNK